jgi:hypothetical protein
VIAANILGDELYIFYRSSNSQDVDRKFLKCVRYTMPEYKRLYIATLKHDPKFGDLVDRPISKILMYQRLENGQLVTEIRVISKLFTGEASKIANAIQEFKDTELWGLGIHLYKFTTDGDKMEFIGDNPHEYFYHQNKLGNTMIALYCNDYYQKLSDVVKAFPCKQKYSLGLIKQLYRNM